MYTTQSNYAWIIDNDREERTIPKIGPWNAPGHLITLLERSDVGVPFKIESNGKVVYTGRILGMFIGEEPFYDLNFIGSVDTIFYKNQFGYWEAIN